MDGIKLAVLNLALALLWGCYSSHKVESTHEIKPIHITIDVNVKIQNELEQKFKTQDEVAKKISDDEAEAALRKYLEKSN